MAKRLSASEFVTIWQTSSSIAEVMKRSGLSRPAASTRASGYRKKGVPLRKMYGTRSPSVDWKGLAALAKALRED